MSNDPQTITSKVDEKERLRHPQKEAYERARKAVEDFVNAASTKKKEVSESAVEIIRKGRKDR